MGRFSFWLGLVGLFVGGSFGVIDLDMEGGVGGAIVGFVAGALLGQGIDLVVAPFLAEREERTLGRWALRLIGLALLVVFCHELYWMLTFISLAADHNIGAEITRSISAGQPRPTLQTTLKDKRWQLALCLARPQHWLLRDDVRGSHETTLELIDLVTGRANAARDDAGGLFQQLRRRIWQANNPLAQTLTDPVLQSAGRSIAELNEELLDKYLPHTWVLRYLPRNFLIPREK